MYCFVITVSQCSQFSTISDKLQANSIYFYNYHLDDTKLYFIPYFPFMQDT